MGNKAVRWLLPVLVLIAFLSLWQGAVLLLALPPWRLPAPTAVLQELLGNWSRLQLHTVATLKLTLLGLLCGAATGIGVGGLLHLFAYARAALYPFLLISQNVPIVALGPLLVMWLGFGLLPKMLLITLICFFPVAISTLSGLSNGDPRLLNYMQMIGASRWTIFRRLELPQAVPALFAGLKIAAAYSVTGAVVAEWLGTNRGLSYYMQLSAKGFETTRVFAAVFIIIALSMALFGAVALLERYCVRWRSVTSPAAVKRGDKP